MATAAHGPGFQGPPLPPADASAAALAAAVAHRFGGTLAVIAGYLQELERDLDAGSPEVATALRGLAAGVAGQRVLLDELLALGRAAGNQRGSG
jgi:signal transduction histidine kinase